VLQGVKSDSFSCPGSILKIVYDTAHPLAYGLEEKGMAYFSRGYAYEIIKDTVIAERINNKKEPEKNGKPPKKKERPNYAKVTPVIVANYPDDSLLMSGWILGDKVIREKAAICDIPFEKGKIVLFGFNIHNRAQSYANFKLLFNAIYYNNSVSSISL